MNFAGIGYQKKLIDSKLPKVFDRRLQYVGRIVPLETIVVEEEGSCVHIMKSVFSKLHSFVSRLVQLPRDAAKGNLDTEFPPSSVFKRSPLHHASVVPPHPFFKSVFQVPATSLLSPPRTALPARNLRVRVVPSKSSKSASRLVVKVNPINSRKEGRHGPKIRSKESCGKETLLNKRWIKGGTSSSGKQLKIKTSSPRRDPPKKLDVSVAHVPPSTRSSSKVTHLTPEQRQRKRFKVKLRQNLRQKNAWKLHYKYLNKRLTPFQYHPRDHPIFRSAWEFESVQEQNQFRNSHRRRLQRRRMAFIAMQRKEMARRRHRALVQRAIRRRANRYYKLLYLRFKYNRFQRLMKSKEWRHDFRSGWTAWKEWNFLILASRKGRNSIREKS